MSSKIMSSPGLAQSTILPIRVADPTNSVNVHMRNIPHFSTLQSVLGVLGSLLPIVVIIIRDDYPKGATALVGLCH
jgi:hypothetical protein